MEQQYELDLVTAMYEQHGAAYSKKRLSGGLLFNDYIEAPVVREMLGSVKRLAGANVLDIGCGPGVYSRLLLNSSANVLGVDSSAAMLNATRDYCMADANAKCGIGRFVHSSFESVDLKGEQFDLILATFMLSYFHDLSLAFAKMREHLAPHGRVIASMLHPVRLFSSRRTDEGYVVSDYFSGGIYAADFLHDNSALPLRRYNFRELHAAAKAGGLKIGVFAEPRANEACGFPDEAKVAFYTRHPSILVLELTAQ